MNAINIEILEKIAKNSVNRYELWVDFIRSYKFINIVEIGVWKAEFAAEVLSNCNDIKKYFLIDPWENLPNWDKPFNIKQEDFECIYKEALQNVSFASEKIVLMREQTKNAVDNIGDKTIDFAYVDGDHTLRGISIDLIKILPKIKDYGFIAGDDFDENILQHGTNFEPTLVYPFSIYFAEAYNLKIIILPFNQFLIQKIPEGRFEFINLTNGYKKISVGIGEKVKEKEKKVWEQSKKIEEKNKIIQEQGQKIQEQEQKLQEQEQKLQEQEQKIHEKEQKIQLIENSLIYKIYKKVSRKS